MLDRTSRRAACTRCYDAKFIPTRPFVMTGSVAFFAPHHMMGIMSI
jgi:hypothetical protein